MGAGVIDTRFNGINHPGCDRRERRLFTLGCSDHNHSGIGRRVLVRVFSVREYVGLGSGLATEARGRGLDSLSFLFPDLWGRKVPTSSLAEQGKEGDNQ